MRIRSAGVALAVAALLASCAPRPAPRAPPPPAAPQPTAEPPRPARPALDWRDEALSAGDWTYNTEGGAGVATFMQDGVGLFVILCSHDRRLSLVRMLTPGGPPLTIRTTYGERSLPTHAASPEARAALPVADPLLDQIVFSRGRFLVRAEGVPDLVLPSWPEPARAIEECRRP